MQGFVRQAATHQQARQLGQVSPDAARKFPASLQQVGVDFSGRNERGEHRVPIQPDR